MPKKAVAIVKKDAAPPEISIQEAHELLGMAKAFEFQRRWITVSTLVALNHAKSTGAYKKIANGSEKELPTWAAFCGRLNLSHKTVDEWLRNLNDYGQDFLQSTESLGLGLRDFRGLRKLPDGQRPEAKNGHLLIPGHEPIPWDDKERVLEGITLCLEAVQAQDDKTLKEEKDAHASTKREVRAATNRADGHHAHLKRFGIDPEAEPPPLVERVIKLGNQAILVSSGLQEIIEEAEEADLGPQAIAEIDRVLVLIEESCSNTRGALVPERGDATQR